MKRFCAVFFAVIPLFLYSQAQPNLKEKKYPSLLWEISGNGIKKPSFLIGTMHVSSKMAFHLPDSFYLALRSAQVVALETNPETWQEDMSKYDLSGDNLGGSNYRLSNYMAIPSEYLNINALKFYNYDKKIERALYSNPSTINNLLYRSYGNKSSDFEEDTYLDMYIFQCGKKWGKRVTGVENYGESMKLMTEAYHDAEKDKTRKERSYDGENDYSADRLQEAYRSGNLDLLDSINQYNSFSAAFDEKFLYRRNEIQANSMDSILRSGSTLFVGVGAAHLPGNRGVIELLRRKGYTLRPVKMGDRDNHDKEDIDRVRVPVVFHTETADDGLFKVDIPGKFYKIGEDESLGQKQYADMANGSYYMVTRTMTNAWMWGHTASDVMHTIDSLLYENIPGKIISKTRIIKGGYPGFDITNRTRRGDLQRYNIFVTPFEIIFFKMSGNGDYVKNGDEANKFFGSIQFKEYDTPVKEWKKYSPPGGGFSIDLPHVPYIGNDGSWIFDAEDASTSTQYRVIRSDIHNYHFVEEDSFDLGLMDESFMASEFIDAQLSRTQKNFKGYPSMDCKYRDKKGSLYLVRFLIQGPHYYTIVARGKKVTPQMTDFLNSFEIKPFTYREAKELKDTSLYFTVNTPVYPDNKKIKLGISRFNSHKDDDEDDEQEGDLLQEGLYRNKVIRNDSTGEKIYISFFRSPSYSYLSDTVDLDKLNEVPFLDDSSWITRSKKLTKREDRMNISETILSDTGSSRILWIKTFYRDGVGYSLLTESDTLTRPSAFVRTFYDTFAPDSSLRGIDPFTRKSGVFFADFFSKDSVAHERAIHHIDDISLDSTDLGKLQQAIGQTGWNEKKYLDVKKSLISKIGDIPSKAASDYLRKLYYALDDTVEVQYTVLESILQQETAYAMATFRSIIVAEPPVLVNGGSDYMPSISQSIMETNAVNRLYNNGGFLDDLNDSLQLTKSILPDLLPLIDLEDYKQPILHILARLVDSNLAGPKDYAPYFNRLLIEAKQELKKQTIAEKKKAIEKAEQSKEVKKPFLLYDRDQEKDYGNDDLALYATLLFPFWDANPSVQPLLRQMLQSNDKQLRYRTLFMFIRNKKQFPDSLLDYFAGFDEYRYELYKDLRGQGLLNRFPARFNDHLDLGKSALLNKRSSGKPDSLVYLDRLPAEYKGKKGFVYFYKYKAKKDDLSWKIATVGLTPEDPRHFDYSDERPSKNPLYHYSSRSARGQYDLTGFTDTKVEMDDGLAKQLDKALKRLLYSHHKSAKEFYQDDNSRSDSDYDSE